MKTVITLALLFTSTAAFAEQCDSPKLSMESKVRCLQEEVISDLIIATAGGVVIGANHLLEKRLEKSTASAELKSLKVAKETLLTEKAISPMRADTLAAAELSVADKEEKLAKKLATKAGDFGQLKFNKTAGYLFAATALGVAAYQQERINGIVESREFREKQAVSSKAKQIAADITDMESAN